MTVVIRSNEAQVTVRLNPASLMIGDVAEEMERRIGKPRSTDTPVDVLMKIGDMSFLVSHDALGWCRLEQAARALLRWSVPSDSIPQLSDEA